MRALFVRLYETIGLNGIVVLLMVLPATLSVSSAAGYLSFKYIREIVLLAAIIVMAIVAVPKYIRSSRAVCYEDILRPLVDSEREYCLVLRPFGWDGEFVVRKANRNGWVGFGIRWLLGVVPTVTLEQLVGTAARNVLGLETYSLVNQRTLYSPPGVTFLRVPNDEWKMVVQRLIRRAHSIFLVVPPHRDKAREGFVFEIEQIVACGMHSRVVIILPCGPHDWWVYRRALQQAHVILTLLNGRDGTRSKRFSVVDYGWLNDRTPLMLKYKEDGTLWYWRILPEKRFRLVNDMTYTRGLVKALEQAERELSGLNFTTRYPMK